MMGFSMMMTFPMLLMASEAEAPQDLMGYLLHSNVFNVLLIVLLLAWAFNKFKLADSFEANRQKLITEIEAAGALKLAAQEELRAIEQRTASLNTEVQAILKQAQEAAQTLSAQIVNQAHEDAQRLREATQKRLAQEEQTAVKALQTRLLADALNEARQALAKRLKAKDHEAAIDRFLTELPRQVAG